MPRLPAKLDGFDLLIEDIADSIPRSVIEHDFPNRDGAVLEDMGSNARAIKFKCWFIDDNYPMGAAFLDYISESPTQNYTLQHPAYGNISGLIKEIAVENPAEFLRTQTIDITFVEELQPNFGTAPISGASPQMTGSDQFCAGLSEELDNSDDALEGPIGDFAEAAINPLQSLVSQFNNATGAALTAIREIDAQVATINGYLLQWAVAADAVANLVSWPATVSGRVLSSIANCLSRIESAVEAVADTPARYITALCADYTMFCATLTDDSTFAWKSQATIAAALAAASYAGTAYEADNQAAKAAQAQEGLPAFDASGNYLDPPAPVDFMSVDDLEKTLAAVRTLLQEAVDADRSNPAPKAMALALLQYVNTVRLTRERVVVLNVPIPTPLHLLCAQNGLSYNAADRVLAINPGIQNPSFCQGSVNIYAN